MAMPRASGSLGEEEGSSVCVNALAPLDSLIQGRPQNVAIPHKIVLISAMAGLGSKQAPIFSCHPCGSSEFQCFITLDTSSARCYVGEPISEAKIAGDPCGSLLLAESSAVRKAFCYLATKHKCYVLDYSNRIEEKIGRTRIWPDVVSALYNVDKIITHCEKSLTGCGQSARLLQDKEQSVCSSSVAGRSQQIYSDLQRFLSKVIERFTPKFSDHRSLATTLEAKRSQYSRDSRDRHNKFTLEGYHQGVWSSEKAILGYVLSLFGLNEPEYSNGPCNGETLVLEGEVICTLPLMQSGKYGGRMKFRGTALTSSRAEEVAAFNALAYMESNFNLKIIDRNYSDRLKAEARSKFLLQLLEDSLDLASNVKCDWSNLIECIGDALEVFACDPDFYISSPFSEEEIKAFQFTASCIKTLHADCQTQYDHASAMFEGIVKLRSKLSILKD